MVFPLPETAQNGQERNLIDELLSEQQLLTPVAQFSRRHENGEIFQEKYYRDLIPLSRPEPGQQYAFAVDLEACTGCKSCVSACHSMNGLDRGETWRNVGVLFGGSLVEPMQKTVTTACHHCVEPGCLLGCPVMAYEKDAETGIVRHLDDQCIGCQYCILKCPYDVPKYHEAKGIVRKCDMCFNRLAADEAPACVAACPTEAIRIEIVEQAEVVKNAPGRQVVPGAFDSGYTKPASRYSSAGPFPAEMKSGDKFAVRSEHTHWPLVIMLTLTQASCGLFLLDTIGRLLARPFTPLLSALGALLLGAGLGASILHLGQPLRAWRVFLGLRTSWLSREVIGFGTWAPPAMGFAALLWLPPDWTHLLPFPLPRLPMSGGVSLLGLACVFCSVMVYVDTRRTFWKMPLTAGKFFGTTLLLGLAGAAALSGATWLIGATLAVGFLKMGGELLFLLQAKAGGWSDGKQSSLVMLLRERTATVSRFGLGLLGLLIFALAANPSVPPAVRAAGLISVGLGELLERCLFFRAVVAPRMPGRIGA